MQIDKKKHGTGGNENYLSAEFCWKMNILYIDRYAFYTEKLLAERLTETIFSHGQLVTSTLKSSVL